MMEVQQVDGYDELIGFLQSDVGFRPWPLGAGKIGDKRRRP